jgi:hypothetical protein
VFGGGVSNYPLTDDEYFAMQHYRITADTVCRVLYFLSSDWVSPLEVGYQLYPNKEDQIAFRSAKNLICKCEKLGFVSRDSSSGHIGKYVFKINSAGLEFLERNS